LDKWDGSVESAMIDAQPEALVVGIGAWNEIPRMLQVLPSLKVLSLRDTRKPLLNRSPEAVVDEQCDLIDAIAMANARALVVCYVHGLDEEHSDIDRAVEWELRAAARAHSRGARYYGFHATYGLFNNAEAQRFRKVWDACDLIGRHAYLGWRFDTGEEGPRSETVFRPEQWDGFPWEKWLPSEAGFDIWASSYDGPGSPGYQVMQRANGERLSESYVMQTMVAVAYTLQAKGGIGLIWYCHAAQNEAEWSNYYETKAMRDYWRATMPPLRLPSFDSRPSNGGSGMSSLEAIKNMSLALQREIEAGKKASSWAEAGGHIDRAFAMAGDIYNEAAAAESAPK